MSAVAPRPLLSWSRDSIHAKRGGWRVEVELGWDTRDVLVGVRWKRGGAGRISILSVWAGAVPYLPLHVRVVRLAPMRSA